MTTANAGLKDPPKFAKNEWAWAYTLDKLATGSGGGLTDEGNPRNYAAAVAIYKRVEEKYTTETLQAMTNLPDQVPAMTRAEVLSFDMPEWVVMRGFAWAANPEAHLRLAHMEGSSGWLAERYTSDGVERGLVEQDTAEWLVRNSQQAVRDWVANHA
jgi:hypothetical protein